MNIYKKFALISVILLISSIMFQSAYAQINFNKVKDKDLVKVIDTGCGYFKRPVVDWTRDKGTIYYSKDKTNWVEVKELPDNLTLFNQNTPTSKIIETDNMFIICSIPFDKGISSDRQSVIRLYDKNFALIKEIDMDYISDISYINGVCYINTYTDYMSDTPVVGSMMSNFAINQTSYYTTDFETWHIYKEDGGIPHTLNDNEIFVKNNLKVSQGNTDSNIMYSESPDKDETLYLSKQGQPKQKIIYENIHFTNSVYLNNYLFTVPSRDSSYVGDLKNYFAVSKDGVYFTTIEMPVITKGYINGILMDINGFEIKGLYELENGNLEIVLKAGQNTEYYEFTTEDLENTILTGDTYVQYDGDILGFDTPPVIEDGSMLVPIRFLFEQMGAEVDWNGEKRTATVTQDNSAVTFAIDDTTATVNNVPAAMDIPARLIDGKTMVPLRFLSEELGYTVTWDEDTRTAIIY